MRKLGINATYELFVCILSKLINSRMSENLSISLEQEHRYKSVPTIVFCRIFHRTKFLRDT